MPVDETKYFFSYARDDSDFALKLAKELRAAITISHLTQNNRPPRTFQEEASSTGATGKPPRFLIV